MDLSNTTEVELDFPPFFCAYKDGRVERFFGKDKVPTSIDNDGKSSSISTKDVLIVPETGVSARIFIPNTIKPHQKLPLLVYFHGGAFLFGSPFCPTYHNYLVSLVSEANVVAVSVDYRLAPEHHVPIAFDDSWAALEWVASHCNNNGDGGDSGEAWLRDHVDFGRVFLAGDSAGGNISHNMAVRAGVEGLPDGVKIEGVCLIQPYFGRKIEETKGEDDDMQKVQDKYWAFVCPTTAASDDPRLYPAKDPNLWRMGCSRILVCLAEKDVLRERGFIYYEMLKNSRWGGVVEMVETAGEAHVFHLFNPSCDKAVALLKRVASFINQD